MQTNLSENGASTGRGTLAMAVDVADYFQVWAWDGFPLRVDASTRRALDLFDAANAKATFFMLGWVAERLPELAHEIVARGHELASHGFEHTKVFDQTPDEFREDARKTKAILEDASGAAVRGYRAAGFSIDRRTPWAYDILAELGHAYSSSSHPIAHDHYGDPDAPQTPYPAGKGDIIEAPVATTTLFGKRVSCAGGGWFRATPYAASAALIERAEKELDGPVIFYFHPWEIDPDQPRFENASFKSRARHYLNLDRMGGKLSRLLASRSWTRIDQALGITA